MDADPVADGELDVAPVRHRERVGLAVLLGRACQRRPPPEDRGPVTGVDRQLDLEQPGLVGEPVGLPLVVDEEHGEQPLVAMASRPPTDHHIGLFPVGRLRVEVAVGQRQADGPAAGVPPPHQSRRSVALVADIPAPARGDADLCDLAVDRAGEPDRGGEQGGERRRLGLRPAFVARHVPRQREGVQVVRPRSGPPRGKHPDQVAVARPLVAGQLLPLPAGRAEQLRQHQPLQLVPHLPRVGRAEGLFGHSASSEVCPPPG